VERRFLIEVMAGLCVVARNLTPFDESVASAIVGLASLSTPY